MADANIINSQLSTLNSLLIYYAVGVTQRETPQWRCNAIVGIDKAWLSYIEDVAYHKK